MHDYIVENYPTQLEVYETCTKLAELDTNKYWCYFKSGRVTPDLYGKEETDFVGVFSKDQNGYKLADERLPFPEEEELIALVDKLEVSGEDLKKTKWQLLAEAYINGRA